MARLVTGKLKQASFRRGLTLVETMMVIFLLGLMVAILSPAILSLQVFQSTAEAADTMRANLVFARNRAIQTNEPVHVLIDLDNSEYSMVQYRRGRSASEPEDIRRPVNLTGNRRIIAIGLPTGVEILEGRYRLIFLPDGSSEEVAIYLGAGQAQIHSTLHQSKYLGETKIHDGKYIPDLRDLDWKVDLER